MIQIDTKPAKDQNPSTENVSPHPLVHKTVSVCPEFLSFLVWIFDNWFGMPSGTHFVYLVHFLFNGISSTILYPKCQIMTSQISTTPLPRRTTSLTFAARRRKLSCSEMYRHLLQVPRPRWPFLLRLRHKGFPTTNSIRIWLTLELTKSPSEWDHRISTRY